MRMSTNSGSISLIGLLGLVAFVLLATGFYFYAKNRISESPMVSGDNSIGATSSAGTDKAMRYAQKCGITIMHPVIGATVSFPLDVKGEVDNRDHERIGCLWASFEGQAGNAKVFANIDGSGWKPVGMWHQTDQTYDSQPLTLSGDWMQLGPVSFGITMMLDSKFSSMARGTPLKLVLEDDDPSAKDETGRLEVPLLYSGENAEMTRLIIHKPIDDHPTDCGQTYAEIRYVPKTVAVADAALRILLNENYPSLKDHYNGLTIKNGVAIVDFDQPALSRFDSAACIQAMTKMPIEKTLKQFPTIKSVEYSIDGVVKKDWDA